VLNANFGDLIEFRKHELFADSLERASFDALKQNAHVLCARSNLTFRVASVFFKERRPGALLLSDFLGKEDGASCNISGRVL